MAGLFGQRGPNAATAPAFGSLQVQTSMYGLTITVAYGRTRISGNMLWYGDFKATKHETSTSMGKGGGGSNSSISYTYSASVMMSLGEGPINGVRTVWQGKTKTDGSATSNRLQNWEGTFTIPSSAPYTVTVDHAATYHDTVWVVGFNLGWHEAGDSGTVQGDLWMSEGAGKDFTVAAGVYTFNVADHPTWAGAEVRINYNATSSTDASSALGAVGLNLANGAEGQTVWPYLSTNFPAQALAYNGMAYVYGQNYSLNDQAQIENHSFEVDAQLQYSTAIPDCDPAAVIADIANNPKYGVQVPAGFIGDLTQYSNYCVANGMFISPAYSDQAPARDRIKAICDATNADAGWNGEHVIIKPRGDLAITGNGVTYTPDNTPVFSMTPDNLVGKDGQDLVQITRIAQEDAYNRVTVEYKRRITDSGDPAYPGYNSEPVEAKDRAAIATFGLRAEGVQAWNFICDGAAANQAATIRLQYIQACRATYSFVAPWYFIYADPGDLVALTEPRLGLNGVIARIKGIEETGESDNSFSVTAEEFPIGHANAPSIDPQPGSGYQPDWNADPGNVNTPCVFEPPLSLAGKAQIWAAVSGASASWGGARIWVSTDGTTYAQLGNAPGRARHGVLTSSMTQAYSFFANPDNTNTLGVDLSASGGVLTSGSNADADAYVTACWVDGEVLSYTTATLTSANHYNLTRLRRGHYGEMNSHSAGAPFVRLDEAVVKMDVDPLMVGKTLHLKFQSFNTFGRALQDLSTLTAYTYTVLGTGVVPDALSLDVQQINPPTKTVTIEVPFMPAGSMMSAILRYSTGTFSWDTATDLRTVAFPFTTWPPKKISGGPSFSFDLAEPAIGGSITFGVKLTDGINVSANAVTTTATLVAGSVRTAALDVYQLNAAPPTAFPSGTSVLTWATGKFTPPTTPNGWSLLPSDGLKLTTTFPTDHTQYATYCYYNTTPYVIQTGDYFEYDVLVESSGPHTLPGGAGFNCTDSTYAWSGSHFSDTYGILVATLPVGQSIHRKLSCEDFIGKTVAAWWFLTEIQQVGSGVEVCAAIFRNMRITNGSGTTRFSAFGAGATPLWPCTFTNWTGVTNEVVFAAPLPNQTLWQVSQPYSDTNTGATSTVSWTANLALPLNTTSAAAMPSLSTKSPLIDWSSKTVLWLGTSLPHFGGYFDSYPALFAKATGCVLQYFPWASSRASFNSAAVGYPVTTTTILNIFSLSMTEDDRVYLADPAHTSTPNIWTDGTDPNGITNASQMTCDYRIKAQFAAGAVDAVVLDHNINDSIYSHGTLTPETLTITGITKGSTTTVTVSSIGTLALGDAVTLSVAGIAKLHHAAARVQSVSGSTFVLNIASTGFSGTFTSGTVSKVDRNTVYGAFMFLTNYILWCATLYDRAQPAIVYSSVPSQYEYNAYSATYAAVSAAIHDVHDHWSALYPGLFGFYDVMADLAVDLPDQLNYFGDGIHPITSGQRQVIANHWVAWAAGGETTLINPDVMLLRDANPRIDQREVIYDELTGGYATPTYTYETTPTLVASQYFGSGLMSGWTASGTTPTTETVSWTSSGYAMRCHLSSGVGTSMLYKADYSFDEGVAFSVDIQIPTVTGIVATGVVAVTDIMSMRNNGGGEFYTLQLVVNAAGVTTRMAYWPANDNLAHPPLGAQEYVPNSAVQIAANTTYTLGFKAIRAPSADQPGAIAFLVNNVIVARAPAVDTHTHVTPAPGIVTIGLNNSNVNVNFDVLFGNWKAYKFAIAPYLSKNSTSGHTGTESFYTPTGFKTVVYKDGVCTSIT